MRKVGIAGFKGGIGKSTSAVTIGVALARAGKRVLLIDCDSQANATDSFGVTAGDSPGTYGLITGSVDVVGALVRVEDHLDLIPASRALSTIDAWLLQRPRPSDVLRKRLAMVTDYNFVICDLPPAFGSMTLNALMAVDEAWLPVSMEYFALQGVKQVIDTLKMLREEADHIVKVRHVIPTFFDSRNAKTRSVMKVLNDNFGDRVTAPVRTSVRLSEAPGHHQSIFDYGPDTSGAEDYRRVTRGILNATASSGK